MIFAAGLGTRLRPLTNDRPKALVEVAGKSLLEWTILKLKAAGYEEFVVNVHHFADKVIEHLQGEQFAELNIQISDEREFLLETGGGLQKARPLLQDKAGILIHNVDIFSDLDLAEFRNQHEASGAIASLAITDRKTSRYLLFDRENFLCGWENVKTGEIKWVKDPQDDARRMAFSGIHLVSQDLLDLMKKVGKYSIIDVYLKWATAYPILGIEHQAERWLDVGKPENLARATEFI